MKKRTWLFIAAAVICGGVLTWLAFGFGVQEKPVEDLSGGLELRPPRDRTGGVQK